MKRTLFTKLTERITDEDIIVVTGMRQVGKTTLLKQVYDLIQSNNKLFLDLENPLNQKYFEKTNYDEIVYQLQLLGIDFHERAYIFLDEVQYVKNIPSVVKYLMGKYPCKFFLTGSASFYLKNLFSESLAGRKIIYELFPLSFAEFLSLKESRLVIPQGTITREIYETIIPLYKEYVDFGAFPGVVTKISIERKREELDDIFTSYFNKEVLTIGGFRNNVLIRDLILLLVHRVGSKLDVSKIARELGTSRITIEEYLSFLQATYFIHLVSPFSTNKDQEIRSTKKIYLCDSGLLRHIAAREQGIIFENALYHQLMLQGKVNYYQRKSGVEIDFILNEHEGYEIKTTANTHDVSQLEQLTRDIQIPKNYIVSYNYVDFPVLYGFQV
jgi:predicted AAA+ superfamily ATPase